MSASAEWNADTASMTVDELRQNIISMAKEWCGDGTRNDLIHIHEYLTNGVSMGTSPRKPNEKHECPDCEEMIYTHEVPKEAPDFICEGCHLRRYYEDKDWREDTDERRKYVD